MYNRNKYNFNLEGYIIRAFEFTETPFINNAT